MRSVLYLLGLLFLVWTAYTALTQVRPGHFTACHLYADPGSATPGSGAARPAGQLV